MAGIKAHLHTCFLTYILCFVQSGLDLTAGQNGADVYKKKPDMPITPKH